MKEKPLRDIRIPNYDEFRASRRLRNPLHPGPRVVADKNAPLGWKNRVFGMTPKQNKFSQVLVTTFDKAEAVKQAYPDVAPHNIAKVADKLLNHPIVRPYVISLLLKANAPELITKKLIELLDSVRPHNSPKGEVMMVADNGVRLKSIVELAHMLGIYPASRHEVTKKEVSLHFDNEPIEVIRFVAEHGRYPNPEEKKELLDESPEGTD